MYKIEHIRKRSYLVGTSLVAARERSDSYTVGARMSPVVLDGARHPYELTCTAMQKQLETDMNTDVCTQAEHRQVSPPSIPEGLETMAPQQPKSTARNQILASDIIFQQNKRGFL